MRTTALAVIAAATLATAQLGSIPSCAMSCISQALPASCNLNPQCICADASFISTISCCVSTACDTAGQQAALGYAQQICAPVGVTNLPTAASCATGSVSSSGTSAAAVATATGSAASSSLSSASQSLSSLASSASQVASSRSSSGSSAAASGTSSAASAVRSASSSVASAASSASSSAAAAATGGAASLNPMGMAGVAALGAFALL
ncbi:MAG: Cysteine proteinase [Aureobasidium pullulans]|nr:MAG: Cysteine proteinase [Aureobasidium pullulans]